MSVETSFAIAAMWCLGFVYAMVRAGASPRGALCWPVITVVGLVLAVAGWLFPETFGEKLDEWVEKNER